MRVVFQRDDVPGANDASDRSSAFATGPIEQFRTRLFSNKLLHDGCIASVG